MSDAQAVVGDGAVGVGQVTPPVADVVEADKQRRVRLDLRERLAKLAELPGAATVGVIGGGVIGLGALVWNVIRALAQRVAQLLGVRVSSPQEGVLEVESKPGDAVGAAGAADRIDKAVASLAETFAKCKFDGTPEGAARFLAEFEAVAKEHEEKVREFKQSQDKIAQALGGGNAQMVLEAARQFLVDGDLGKAKACFGDKFDPDKNELLQVLRKSQVQESLFAAAYNAFEVVKTEIQQQAKNGEFNDSLNLNGQYAAVSRKYRSFVAGTDQEPAAPLAPRYAVTLGPGAQVASPVAAVASPAGVDLAALGLDESDFSEDEVDLDDAAILDQIEQQRAVG